VNNTKRDRLIATISHAHDLWKTEQFCQARNAVNEGAWSIQVIEPILAALDWQRLLRRRLDGTGAYFEWPGKHQVDVALLANGVPKAFLELKDKHVGKPSCHNDLKKKLRRHPELLSCHLALAAWFAGAAGFCLYAIQPDGSISPGACLPLSDGLKTSEGLAAIAGPVVLQNISAADWLNSPEEICKPIVPRCNPRDVQRRFFELLHAKLAIRETLETRFRCTTFEPPSPTYAYADLAGVLPQGQGLVFDFDNTMNQLQCFFYNNGNTKIGATRRMSFDECGITDNMLLGFIDNYVVPEIARRQA
jgi:hypothetical protein